MGCVPENSTYGGVNVAENAPSCALCVVFAHRLVPDQWDDKRFMLDAVEIFFFAVGNSVKHWKGLPRQVESPPLNSRWPLMPWISWFGGVWSKVSLNDLGDLFQHQ